MLFSSMITTFQSYLLVTLDFLICRSNGLCSFQQNCLSGVKLMCTCQGEINHLDVFFLFKLWKFFTGHRRLANNCNVLVPLWFILIKAEQGTNSYRHCKSTTTVVLIWINTSAPNGVRITIISIIVLLV